MYATASANSDVVRNRSFASHSRSHSAEPLDVEGGRGARGGDGEACMRGCGSGARAGTASGAGARAQGMGRAELYAGGDAERAVGDSREASRA